MFDYGSIDPYRQGFLQVKVTLKGFPQLNVRHRFASDLPNDPFLYKWQPPVQRRANFLYPGDTWFGKIESSIRLSILNIFVD
jgi:hypothetical protein